MHATTTGPRPGPIAIVLIGIAQILVWGSSFFILAVIASPIMKETGWNREWVYGALSMSICLSGLLLPAIGKLVAQNRGRMLLCASGVAAAAGVALMASSHSLALFFFAWVILGVAMALGLYDTLYAALGNCYGRNAKSAITTVTLISGFCTSIMWPLLAAGVVHVGWRDTCYILAAVLLVTIIPVYRCALPAGSAAPAVQKRRASGAISVDRKTYHLMSTIFMIAAVIMTALSVQLIDILQSRGMGIAAAIGISALLGPSQVASRVFDIFLNFKNPIFTLIISVVLVLAGLVLLLFFPALAAISVVIYGAGNGLRSIVRGTLPLYILKEEEFAVVMGKIARPSLIAQGMTPFVAGFLYERFGANALLAAMALLAFISIVLSLYLKSHLNTVRRHALTTVEKVG